MTEETKSEKFKRLSDALRCIEEGYSKCKNESELGLLKALAISPFDDDTKSKSIESFIN